jgi:DNA-binding transcriptional regulator YiaG
MSEDDFAPKAIDALNQGDPKKLYETILKSLSANDIAGALLAGIALGRAEKLNAPPAIPEQARDLLNRMAASPSAAAEFKKMRKGLGISLTAVADLCGVDHQTIINWETGAAPMPANAIGALVRLSANKVPAKAVTGADIRDLRKALGMSRETLAEALGVHAQSIVRWEAAPDKPIPASTLQRIWAKLNELFAQAGMSLAVA